MSAIDKRSFRPPRDLPPFIGCPDMTENNRTERETRASYTVLFICQSRRVFKAFHLTFGLLCLSGSVVCFTMAFTFFCPLCSRPDFRLELTNGMGSVFLFSAGLYALCRMVFCKRRQDISTTPDVVISEIPAEDLDKSPAPILPYCHTPHHSPFVDTSSIDLPDYYTAVYISNGDEASSANPPDYDTAVKTMLMHMKPHKTGYRTVFIPNTVEVNTPSTFCWSSTGL